MTFCFLVQLGHVDQHEVWIQPVPLPTSTLDHVLTVQHVVDGTNELPLQFLAGTEDSLSERVFFYVKIPQQPAGRHKRELFWRFSSREIGAELSCKPRKEIKVPALDNRAIDKHHPTRLLIECENKPSFRNRYLIGSRLSRCGGLILYGVLRQRNRTQRSIYHRQQRGVRQAECLDKSSIGPHLVVDNRENSSTVPLMQLKDVCRVVGSLPFQIRKCSEHLSVSSEKGWLRHRGKAFGPGDVLLSHRDIFGFCVSTGEEFYAVTFSRLMRTEPGSQNSKPAFYAL